MEAEQLKVEAELKFKRGEDPNRLWKVKCPICGKIHMYDAGKKKDKIVLDNVVMCQEQTDKGFFLVRRPRKAWTKRNDQSNNGGDPGRQENPA